MKKPETRRRILEPQQTSFPDIFYTDTGRWFQPMLDRRVLFGLQRESSRGAHEIYMKRSRRSDRAHNERHGSPPHCPRSFAERTGCTGYAPLATMAKSPPKNRDPWREHCLFRSGLLDLSGKRFPGFSSTTCEKSSCGREMKEGGKLIYIQFSICW